MTGVIHASLNEGLNKSLAVEIKEEVIDVEEA